MNRVRTDSRNLLLQQRPRSTLSISMEDPHLQEISSTPAVQLWSVCENSCHHNGSQKAS